MKKFLTLLVVSLGLGTTAAKTQELDKTTLEKTHARAIFAGGCFWCVEDFFRDVDGIARVRSGYTGGKTLGPTYEAVSEGGTGHVEAVEIFYDPKKVSYMDVLKVYWVNIDPFDAKGQFCDKGESYRAKIFFVTAEQKQQALSSKNQVEKILGQKVMVPIEKAEPFYEAEDYHQRYAEKNPRRYKLYKHVCGRPHRLKEVWGENPDLPLR